MRRLGLLAPFTVAVVSTSVAPGPQAPTRWTVESAPALVLGESQADTNDMFTQVVGATRLPDGRVLVGDLGSFALRLFSSDGRLLKRFGRKGAGPGEIGHLKTLLRCGDSVVTMDIDGNRTSVFSLGGEYVRTFRFGSPQAGRPSYQSACNARGEFVHFGWETMADAEAGAYRPMVPLWLTGTDSAVRRLIATIPGSERHGRVVGGQVRGWGPLLLGKQTAIAIGSDRVYVAAGDRYEIAVYDLSGEQLAALGEPRAVKATEASDIRRLKERTLSAAAPERRAAIERYLGEMPFPKTLPTYSDLKLDRAGNLWAQDFPRDASAVSAWTILDGQGRRVASAELPRH